MGEIAVGDLYDEAARNLSDCTVNDDHTYCCNFCRTFEIEGRALRETEAARAHAAAHRIAFECLLDSSAVLVCPICDQPVYHEAAAQQRVLGALYNDVDLVKHLEMAHRDALVEDFLADFAEIPYLLTTFVEKNKRATATPDSIALPTTSAASVHSGEMTNCMKQAADATRISLSSRQRICAGSTGDDEVFHSTPAEEPAPPTASETSEMREEEEEVSRDVTESPKKHVSPFGFVDEIRAEEAEKVVEQPGQEGDGAEQMEQEQTAKTPDVTVEQSTAPVTDAVAVVEEAREAGETGVDGSAQSVSHSHSQSMDEGRPAAAAAAQDMVDVLDMEMADREAFVSVISCCVCGWDSTREGRGVQGGQQLRAKLAGHLCDHVEQEAASRQQGAAGEEEEKRDKALRKCWSPLVVLLRAYFASDKHMDLSGVPRAGKMETLYRQETVRVFGIAYPLAMRVLHGIYGNPFKKQPSRLRRKAAYVSPSESGLTIEQALRGVGVGVPDDSGWSTSAESQAESVSGASIIWLDELGSSDAVLHKMIEPKRELCEAAGVAVGEEGGGGGGEEGVTTRKRRSTISFADMMDEEEENSVLFGARGLDDSFDATDDPPPPPPEAPPDVEREAIRAMLATKPPHLLRERHRVERAADKAASRAAIMARRRMIQSAPVSSADEGGDESETSSRRAGTIITERTVWRNARRAMPEGFVPCGRRECLGTPIELDNQASVAVHMCAHIRFDEARLAEVAGERHGCPQIVCDCGCITYSPMGYVYHVMWQHTFENKKFTPGTLAYRVMNSMEQLCWTYAQSIYQGRLKKSVRWPDWCARMALEKLETAGEEEREWRHCGDPIVNAVWLEKWIEFSQLLPSVECDAKRPDRVFLSLPFATEGADMRRKIKWSGISGRNAIILIWRTLGGWRQALPRSSQWAAKVAWESLERKRKKHRELVRERARRERLVQNGGDVTLEEALAKIAPAKASVEEEDEEEKEEEDEDEQEMEKEEEQEQENGQDVVGSGVVISSVGDVDCEDVCSRDELEEGEEQTEEGGAGGEQGETAREERDGASYDADAPDTRLVECRFCEGVRFRSCDEKRIGVHVAAHALLSARMKCSLHIHSDRPPLVCPLCPLAIAVYDPCAFIEHTQEKHAEQAENIYHKYLYSVFPRGEFVKEPMEVAEPQRPSARADAAVVLCERSHVCGMPVVLSLEREKQRTVLEVDIPVVKHILWHVRNDKALELEVETRELLTRTLMNRMSGVHVRQLLCHARRVAKTIEGVHIREVDTTRFIAHRIDYIMQTLFGVNTPYVTQLVFPRRLVREQSGVCMYAPCVCRICMADDPRSVQADRRRRQFTIAVKPVLVHMLSHVQTGVFSDELCTRALRLTSPCPLDGHRCTSATVAVRHLLDDHEHMLMLGLFDVCLKEMGCLDVFEEMLDVVFGAEAWQVKEVLGFNQYSQLTVDPLPEYLLMKNRVDRLGHRGDCQMKLDKRAMSCLCPDRMLPAKPTRKRHMRDPSLDELPPESFRFYEEFLETQRAATPARDCDRETTGVRPAKEPYFPPLPREGGTQVKSEPVEQAREQASLPPTPSTAAPAAEPCVTAAVSERVVNVEVTVRSGRGRAAETTPPQPSATPTPATPAPAPATHTPARVKTEPGTPQTPEEQPSTSAEKTAETQTATPVRGGKVEAVERLEPESDLALESNSRAPPIANVVSEKRGPTTRQKQKKRKHLHNLAAGLAKGLKK